MIAEKQKAIFTLLAAEKLIDNRLDVGAKCSTPNVDAKSRTKSNDFQPDG